MNILVPRVVVHVVEHTALIAYIPAAMYVSKQQRTIIFVRNKVHWHFYFRVFMQLEFSHSSVSPEVGVHCVGKCNLLFWWVR